MARAPSAARFTYLPPLVAIVLIVAILYLAKTFIVPLALAVLLTFVLAPLVSAIQHRGVPRVPAVLLTVLLAFALFGLVGWIVGMQVHALARELPKHRKEIDAKIAGLRGSGEGAFGQVLQMVREIGKGETQAEAADEAPAKERVVVVQPAGTSGFEQLASAAGPVLEPLAQAGLILIMVIFMLIKREDLRNRVIGLLGHGQLAGTTQVLVDTAQRLSRFLLTQLLINVSFGAVFGIGLFFLGVPYAPLWGFLTAVLRFIPYVGTWAAAALPLILSFAISATWTQPVLVLTFFAILDLVTANVIEPLFFGHGTGVSPIALVIAATFWTWIWGPVGLVLSTPLTVCLVVLGQRVPRLRVLGLLLGDKPALAPYVSYYQRLLARDQVEATQVARAQQVNGLASVYDEVLLPALGLARRDRRRAGLSGEDEAFILQATRAVVESLGSEPRSDAKDLAVPAAPVEAPAAAVLVLGCPAHDAAEELTLAMLGQLLQPEGCRLDVMSTKALPAEIEDQVARQGAALAFIAVLPPGGIIQARYLCKRLRKRFADLPIVVGYWGGERQYDKILIRLRAAGATYVTTSLHQSRDQVRALTRASAAPAAPAAPALAPSLSPTGAR